MHDPSDCAALNETEMEVELSFDRAAGIRFWNVVLLFASSDSASRVCFCPSKGENCLMLTVDGREEVMEPPPEEYRVWLFQIDRELVGDLSWRGSIRRFFRSRRRAISGKVPAHPDYGGNAWNVTWLPAGEISFEREA